MLELSHITSHLLWLGPFMTDIGAQTPFFYIFIKKKKKIVYDLFEVASGLSTSGAKVWAMDAVDPNDLTCFTC
ncbi:hypothetical protein EV2_027710 [Malus domestica]